MHLRSTLVLVALVLLGGAGVLWWNDRQLNIPATAPIALPVGAPADDERSPLDMPEQALVLAISWHPAFCETARGKPECRKERSGDYAALNLTLHGLWPDDDYCGVGEEIYELDADGRWDELPEPQLGPDTRASLEQIMPGTMDHLHRHEWIKHGTCSYADAETYYRAAMALVEAVNASAAGRLFADSVGGRLTRDDVRNAFDAAFGPGAGRKVRLDCERDGSRGLVSEMRINLFGRLSDDLASLLHAARDTGAGCTGGIIDRAGDQ